MRCNQGQEVYALQAAAGHPNICSLLGADREIAAKKGVDTLPL